MKVALYSRGFTADKRLNSGMSIAVGGLAEGLVENGVPAIVLCEGATRISRVAEGGYSIECFPRVTRRPFALSPTLKRYLADHLTPGQTVCVLNTMFNPSVYAMSRWLQRNGIPYVAAPHDPYDPAVFRSNPHIKWPYWYLCESRMLRQAGAVQVLDPRHGVFLPELGIETPIIETENGVTAERVMAESDLRWGNPDTPPRFIFIGRFDAYNKGLDILLDAFARVADGNGARLTLRGPDKGDRPMLESHASRAGLSESVSFFPPDFDRSPPQILIEHDVFCSPSRFEGFGLAALEAMLAARVLLVSEKAGIARHVVASGCGVTVPPTVDGVVAGFKALLRRRDKWREMGLKGRNYALATLHWGRIAANLIPRYQALLG